MYLLTDGEAADWIINLTEDTMKYDDLIELFKDRRSIPKFKSDPIPDEYVDKIIEAARFAPSGFNTQPWEFVLIKIALNPSSYDH